MTVPASMLQASDPKSPMKERRKSVSAASGDGQPRKKPTVFTPGNYCKSVTDYKAKHGAQISFKSGEVIRIVEKYPTGWWKGEAGGLTGLFPARDVEEITEEEAKRLIAEEAAAAAKAGPSEKESKPKKASRKKKKKKPICLVRAKYAYKGESKSEISFSKGDEIIVYKIVQEDGWWRGEIDGKVGHFPGKV